VQVCRLHPRIGYRATGQLFSLTLEGSQEEEDDNMPHSIAITGME
jgi:hypothetical protein